nr:hypothetical protein [Klebsiella quasipneumoniae]
MSVMILIVDHLPSAALLEFRWGMNRHIGCKAMFLDQLTSKFVGQSFAVIGESSWGRAISNSRATVELMRVSARSASFKDAPCRRPMQGHGLVGLWSLK